MKFHTLRYILIVFFFVIGLPSYGCVCPSWDNNGNLFRFQDCEGNRGRFHDWDEENRLRMVIGNEHAGYYGYDAKGDRIYKLLGKCSIDDFRTHRTNAATLLYNAVLYPNPYITITKKDYYKHYYWGAERFATIIGKGGFDMMSTDAISTLSQNEATKKDAILERYHTDFPLGELYFEPWQNMDIDTRVDENLQYHCPQTQLFQIKVEYDQDLLLGIIHDNDNLNEQEKDIYYTSANHLGSSSWITAFDGKPIQYIHYLPYGQLLANQRIALYDERFKFIGKERDMESGYDYFGARYYIPPFLHWSSVDPLSDKYPSISPYAYCAWNPVKFVDPDGQEWLTEEDAQQAAKYTQAMENKISKLSSKLAKTKSEIKQDVLNQRISTLQEGITELQDMGKVKDMKFTYLNLPPTKAGYTEFKDANTIVMAVPNGSIPLGIHESSHGYDYWKQGGTYHEHEKIPAEIKAYKRQFSYDRFSLPWSDEHKYPKNFDQITPSWVQNIYLIGNENEKIFPYRNK